MPTERLSMRKIRDVLRLKFERGERARDRAFYVAEQRLGELLSPARPHGGPRWPLPDDLDDGALERLLFPPAGNGGGGARTS